MTAVDFLDQFRDCFVLVTSENLKVEGIIAPCRSAMVAVADTKKQRPPTGYSKAYDKEEVKSNTPGVNLAVDPEAPVTFLN